MRALRSIATPLYVKVGRKERARGPRAIHGGTSYSGRVQAIGLSSAGRRPERASVESPHVNRSAGLTSAATRGESPVYQMLTWWPRSCRMGEPSGISKARQNGGKFARTPLTRNSRGECGLVSNWRRNSPSRMLPRQTCP